ncbi:SulP family inorganic anion transporter [bacterium]|nr:SulP family inorganic anion transporter [bacterium]
MRSFLLKHFQWELFKNNLKKELISGFIVFLVALPLSIGISLASGAPATAGIFAAVVGGILGSLMGGGHVMINGPAAGLIVVILTSIQTLGQGDVQAGFKLTLAAIVFSGVIQVVLGVFRLGSLGFLAPVQVIHGMLASIGVTVIVKQVYVLCGLKPQGIETFEQILHLPHTVFNANEAILGIGLATIVLILFLSKSKNRWIKLLPAPLAAVCVGMGFDKFFDFEHPHMVEVFHHSLGQVSNAFLLHVPEKLTEGLVQPDWSMVSKPIFWKMTLMICFVASIESILSASAVDKMDPEKRRSPLNTELISKGFCNVLLGLIGGLPIITEMVRSNINISNGAKTRWPNFIHGLLILLFVAFAPGILNLIPLASFAAILILVGFRLANPKQLFHAHEVGWEQLLLFVTTLLVSLKTDLLVGVFSGIFLKLILNCFRARSVVDLFRLRTSHELRDHIYMVALQGPVVFTNLLGFRKVLKTIPKNVKQVTLDFRKSRLVDHTVLDFIESEKGFMKDQGVQVQIIFSENHVPAGKHPLSSQVLRD